MTYECEMKEQAAQPVLSVRTRTAVENLPQALGQAYGVIAQYLSELGLQPAGPPFAGYFNMDMQDLDVEIGFPVAVQIEGKGDIKNSEIPAGKVAVKLFKGSYSDIEPAYNELMEWITREGREATGIVYEFYLNDPAETPPEELLTQILFLLK